MNKHDIIIKRTKKTKWKRPYCKEPGRYEGEWYIDILMMSDKNILYGRRIVIDPKKQDKYNLAQSESIMGEHGERLNCWQNFVECLARATIRTIEKKLMIGDYREHIREMDEDEKMFKKTILRKKNKKEHN